MLRNVPRTVRLLAFGAFLNGVVSFTFGSLHAGASISGQVLAPPLGGALYATAPQLLWPACALLAGGAGLAVLAARRLRGPGPGTAQGPVRDVPAGQAPPVRQAQSG